MEYGVDDPKPLREPQLPQLPDNFMEATHEAMLILMMEDATIAFAQGTLRD